MNASTALDLGSAIRAERIRRGFSHEARAARCAELVGQKATDRDLDLMKRVASGELTTEQAIPIALGTTVDRASA